MIITATEGVSHSDVPSANLSFSENKTTNSHQSYRQFCFVFVFFCCHDCMMNDFAKIDKWQNQMFSTWQKLWSYILSKFREIHEFFDWYIINTTHTLTIFMSMTPLIFIKSLLLCLLRLGAGANIDPVSWVCSRPWERWYSTNGGGGTPELRLICSSGAGGSE